MTPPNPIGYRDARTLRTNEAILLSQWCQEQAQSRGDSAALDDDCVRQRQCIDEKNTLEDLRLVLRGCATQSDLEGCAQRAIATRQAAIAQCSDEKLARQRRIKTLLDEVRYVATTFRRALCIEHPEQCTTYTPFLYQEGVTALTSPECDTDRRSAMFRSRYGEYVALHLQRSSYALARLDNSCDDEQHVMTAYYGKSFQQCLETSLNAHNLNDVHAANQCVGNAVRTTWQVLWPELPLSSLPRSVPQEWEKFYTSTQRFLNDLLVDNKRAVAALEKTLTEAEGKRLPAATDLQTQLAALKKAIAAQALPPVDPQAELTAHRNRVKQRVEAFAKRIAGLPDDSPR